MDGDERLMAEIEGAAAGLSFMSESDFPFVTFRWEGLDDVTPEFLRGLTGHDPSAPVEALSADQFFRAAASEPEWKSAAELETARRYQSLLRLLKEGLSELRVYRVGTINMPVYVVGRGPSGAWMGLSTRVVET